MSAASRFRSAWQGGPLADRNFRLLTAGQFTSTVGDFCYAVALPWLVLSTHGGPVLLGTVLACYGVPRTIGIPLGGMLADKLRPRTIMLTADLVHCVLVARDDHAAAAVGARRVAWPDYGRGDAGQYGHLPGLGGAVRRTGAIPRPDPVLPGGRSRSAPDPPCWGRV